MYARERAIARRLLGEARGPTWRCARQTASRHTTKRNNGVTGVPSRLLLGEARERLERLGHRGEDRAELILLDEVEVAPATHRKERGG